MDFFTWLQLAVICFFGAISPGPSLTVIVQNSINGGRLQGIMAGAGHGAGITVYAFGAATGLTVIMLQIPKLFIVINILGALFLIWLGIQLIYNSLLASKPVNPQDLKNRSRGFVEGFLIVFLNPKVAVFFLALFSQYLRPDAPWFEKFLIVTTAGVIDTLWYFFVAILLTQTSAINWLRINSKLFDQLMGVILILIAAGLLFRSHFSS